MSDPAVRCSGSGWKEGSSKAEVTQLICCLKYLQPCGDSSVCLQLKAESDASSSSISRKKDESCFIPI